MIPKLKRKPKQTGISKALQYLQDYPGSTPYEAAQAAGIAATAVYKRLKRDAAKKSGICPCCGQKLAIEGHKD